MDPQLTGDRYDRIAERWDSDRFNRQNGIQQHLRALAFLRSREWALDVGCGCSGRFIDMLLQEGFRVEGVDVSARMIELAMKRHPEVAFHNRDICQWALPRSYDFITAWDSIWHVPFDSQEAVLRKLAAALRPGGVLIFTAGGLDAPAEKTDRAMGPEVYYSVIGIPRTLQLLDECGCVCRHLEYDQYPEQHLYVIAQKSLAAVVPGTPAARQPV